VGGSQTTLTLFNWGYEAGLTAYWNGSPRPTAYTGTSSYTYSMTLTAPDLAAPQLATITMVDAAGAVVDTENFAVVYNVQPTGLALDVPRNRLYVATPTAQSADPNFPANSVVALDLTTGKTVASLQADGPLGDLALSGDGSALYVVVETDGVVEQVDPTSFKVVGNFSFRPAQTQIPNYGMTDMLALMPGQPGTLAMWSAPDGGGIAIYDNGVKRPNTISDICCELASVLFSPDGKYLFANGDVTFQTSEDSYDYQYVTFRYAIDSTGIPGQTPLYAEGGGPAAFLGNSLYPNLPSSTFFVGNLTTVIDYTTVTLTGNLATSGALAVDGANQRAFVVYTPPDYDDEGDHAPTEIVAYSLPSLEPIGSLPIGLSALGSLNVPEQLMRFGTDGIVLPSQNGLLIFHTPLAGPGPVTTAAGVVNAASQQAGAIAPGEILSIYGSNLGPAMAVPAVGDAAEYPMELSNVQVSFGDLPGVILMAYQGQINVVAPMELLPGNSVNLQVSYLGVPSAVVPLSVAADAPALFTQNSTGFGPVAVINQDGSVNTPSPAGSIVALYGTGGVNAPGAIDGDLARIGGRFLTAGSGDDWRPECARFLRRAGSRTGEWSVSAQRAGAREHAGRAGSHHSRRQWAGRPSRSDSCDSLAFCCAGQ
jgi:uncharacterized protein (TIGR03437 family)